MSLHCFCSSVGIRAVKRESGTEEEHQGGDDRLDFKSFNLNLL